MQVSRRQLLAVVPAAAAGYGMKRWTRPAGGLPKRLVVADVGSLPLDDQLMLCCLQGLANRPGPRLYLEGIRSAQDFAIDATAAGWLADAVGLPTTWVQPADLLEMFRSVIRGLVVWDPTLPYDTQNVATTMCGLSGTLPVSPARADELTKSPHRLRVVADLRRQRFTSGSQAYRWALASMGPPSRFGILAWTGWPRNGNPVQPGLRDWIVARRGFAFDGSPTGNGEPFAAGNSDDNGLFVEQLLSSFPPDTAVFGYPFVDDSFYRASGQASGEPFGVGEVSHHGDYLVPSLDCTNLTVHSSFAAPRQHPPWDDHSRKPDPALTYVTFLLSDGDSLGYNEHGLRTRHWSDPARGTIPMGISISPWLAVYAPRLYRYYVQGLRSSEVLVAGPSGAGYAYPSLLPDLDGYLRRTRQLMDLSGLRAVWILDNGYAASPPPWVTARYAAILRPSAIFADYGGWAVPNPPAISFSGDVPVIHAAWGPDVDSTVLRVRLAAAAAASRPAFVTVGLTTWTMGYSQAGAVMAALGPGYRAVRPDELIGLVRGSGIVLEVS